MWCATYRRAGSSELRILKREINNNFDVTGERRKFPMFVRIRDKAKDFCPTASVAWLQRLNTCYMSSIETFKVGIYPSLESLFLVFNRKLSEVLLNAGVTLRELENEVIKSGTQVVTDLPNQNGDTHRHDEGIWPEDLRVMRGIRIELGDSDIAVEFGQRSEPRPQITKMFFCPDYSFESAIEYVRGHAIIPE
jgi:hypothetical protein